MACGMVLKNAAFNEVITQFMLGQCWLEKGHVASFLRIYSDFFSCRPTPICATLLSTSPCCCSFPTWRPSRWLSASPAWSSRRWRRSVEYWVSFVFVFFLSQPLWFHFCLTLCSLFCLSVINKTSLSDLIFNATLSLVLPDASSSTSDIRRSEELSLLKPPDDPSKKKKKKEKEHEHEDLWDIDLLSMGPGSAGTALLTERKI